VKVFYILKGLIIGLSIPCIIFLLVVSEQRSHIKELTNQLIESEVDKHEILTAAKGIKVACEANMEATAQKERLLRKAINNMGLGDHVKFQENRLILSQGGGD